MPKSTSPIGKLKQAQQAMQKANNNKKSADISSGQQATTQRPASDVQTQDTGTDQKVQNEIEKEARFTALSRFILDDSSSLQIAGILGINTQSFNFNHHQDLRVAILKEIKTLQAVLSDLPPELRLQAPYKEARVNLNNMREKIFKDDTNYQNFITARLAKLTDIAKQLNSTNDLMDALVILGIAKDKKSAAKLSIEEMVAAVAEKLQALKQECRLFYTSSASTKPQENFSIFSTKEKEFSEFSASLDSAKPKAQQVLPPNQGPVTPQSVQAPTQLNAQVANQRSRASVVTHTTAGYPPMRQAENFLPIPLAYPEQVPSVKMAMDKLGYQVKRGDAASNVQHVTKIQSIENNEPFYILHTANGGQRFVMDSPTGPTKQSIYNLALYFKQTAAADLSKGEPITPITLTGTSNPLHIQDPNLRKLFINLLKSEHLGPVIPVIDEGPEITARATPATPSTSRRI